jgi:hypothetical protein
MIPAFLVSRFGATAAKRIFFAIIVLFVLIVLIGLAKCGGVDRTAERQAEQTTRSGDASANAASAAIDTIENRHDADTTGDAAVAATQGTIDNAQNPDDVRSAVLDGVCAKASHRNDPACPVR